MFLKPKSFKKSKTLYLLVGSFLRKIFLYTDLYRFNLCVKRKPLYLQEIVNSFFNPSTSIYKHPFNQSLVFEKYLKLSFKIPYYIFISNKNFSYQKPKLKGRLKRRIKKRLVKINNVLD